MVFLPLLLTMGLTSEWIQYEFAYVEVEKHYEVKLEVNDSTTQTEEVEADEGVDQRAQQIIGAAAFDPPTWHSYFSPLTNQQGRIEWDHAEVTLQPGWAIRVTTDWYYQQGWQQFQRWDDGQPSGVMLRRDRDWHQPNGFTEQLYQHITGGGNGGGG